MLNYSFFIMLRCSDLPLLQHLPPNVFILVGVVSTAAVQYNPLERDISRTSGPETHWIAPVLSGIPFGFANLTIFFTFST